jgi:hypothetical protein
MPAWFISGAELMAELLGFPGGVAEALDRGVGRSRIVGIRPDSITWAMVDVDVCLLNSLR